MQAMPGRPAPPPPAAARKTLTTSDKVKPKSRRRRPPAPSWTSVTSLPRLYLRGWRGRRDKEVIDNQRSWIVTVIACVVAAITRLPRLGATRKLIFDETYYVKDAYSLWHFGYETNWPKGGDVKFAAGDFAAATADPAFVVHPPLGKWIIGLGMKLFGWSNPFGWRIAAAICGIILVYLTCRLAWALFDSWILTGIAGIFIATDG
ncbi:MAG: glycosyltransferase family 39 protein [Varibaculum cambriense]